MQYFDSGKNLSNRLKDDNFPSQLSRILHRHRRSTPPLAVVDGQQAVSVID